MLSSSICFSLSATLVKFLKDIPLMQIVLFRNLPTLIIIFFLLKSKNISIYGNNKKLLFLRAFLGSIGMIATFYTFKYMVLADAITLTQLIPLFTIILSVKLLGEKVSFRQMSIFSIAFIGAILVIKPGLRLNILPYIVGLIGAFTLAAGQVTIRKLRISEQPMVIVIHYAFISSLSALFALFWQKNFILPNIFDFSILIMLGFSSLWAQFSLTMAFNYSPARLVSLYTYIKIIFGILIGIFLFKEIPDIFSVIGAFFILIMGYINYKYNS